MNLHGPVRAAEVEGTAKVVISLSTWSEGKVQPTVHEVTVRPAKKGRKLEPVTDRLLRTLPHPDLGVQKKAECFLKSYLDKKPT